MPRPSRTGLLAQACAALALCALPNGGARAAATEIDFFFPVPVQGQLANEMQRVVEQFNAGHPDIHVTASYTGSYDDTSLKTRAAMGGGRPPAVVLQSANYIRDFAIAGEAIPLDPLIAEREHETPVQFMDRFWPALRSNAVEAGHVHGVPFQNSTPLLYYSVDAFREVGLDPDQPPATWAEWVEAAKKLTKRDPGGQVVRWGLMMNEVEDNLMWLVSGFAMSNGGQYFDPAWGGEVYYNEPSTLGAVRFLDDLVHKYKVMPEGTNDANAMTAAFFSGRAGMILNSTGALSFIRQTMKTPYRVAFVPRALVNAAPIGGGSLMIPAGNSPERQQAAWTLIKWLTSPAIAGGWSRFTGYFAPNRAAYDLPEMQAYLKQYPDARVALDQLQYARPWFATYQTVPVRKALGDQVQAMLSGRVSPAEAVATGQRAAAALLRPYAAQPALKLP